MYINIRIWIYMYVYVYVFIHIRIYTNIYVHVYLHVSTHIYLYVHKYILFISFLILLFTTRSACSNLILQTLNTVHHSAPQCTTVQHTAPRCNTLQQTFFFWSFSARSAYFLCSSCNFESCFVSAWKYGTKARDIHYVCMKKIHIDIYIYINIDT